MARRSGENHGGEREKLSCELKCRTPNPGPVPFVDPRVESVYEFRPDLNATVETTPDARQFIVEFRDGGLNRESSEA
jgi:hypothetical protein